MQERKESLSIFRVPKIISFPHIIVGLPGLSVSVAQCFFYRFTNSPVLGFEIRLTVDRDVTHLVSFRNHGIKVRRAKAWGSQIVTHDWLLKMAETGKLEPEEGYHLHIPPENLRGSRSKLLTRGF